MQSDSQTKDGSASLADAAGSPLRFPDIGDRYEKRTQHWIIEREVTGLNGLGLPWLRETWKWPSGGTCRENILTLGIEDTLKMLEEFTLLLSNAEGETRRPSATHSGLT